MKNRFNDAFFVITAFGCMAFPFVSQADTLGFTAGQISPNSITPNTTQTYTMPYSSGSGLLGCELYVNGVDTGAWQLGNSSSTGNATISTSFPRAGSYTVNSVCRSSNGTFLNSPISQVSVTGTAVVTPQIPMGLIQNYSTPGSAPSFSWNTATNGGNGLSYQVQLDNGAWVPVGNVTNYTGWPLATGSHTFAIRSVNAQGDVSAPMTSSFYQSAPAMSASAQGTALSFSDEANLLLNDDRGALARSLHGGVCELSADGTNLRISTALGGSLNTNYQSSVQNFYNCGTVSTWGLGAGERLGILGSYRANFNRLPTSQSDWADVMRIAQGKAPLMTSPRAEASARTRFSRLFARNPDLSNAQDYKAVMMMAYGLRHMPRNLQAEADAIATFNQTYHHNPSSAADWDTVRAIAYAGVTR